MFKSGIVKSIAADVLDGRIKVHFGKGGASIKGFIGDDGSCLCRICSVKGKAGKRTAFKETADMNFGFRNPELPGQGTRRRVHRNDVRDNAALHKTFLSRN